MDSNLAESFYDFISQVPVRKWWHFIRFLGLPESDIDEIFYDDDDPSEQKYQMLSRWKSYYGYKKPDKEIVDVLNLAYREVTGTSNTQPEVLNRRLQGHLQENRLIARKFYEIMNAIDVPLRKKFASVKLGIPEAEINAIRSDYGKDTDEQCYQMFLSWKRRTKMSLYQDIRDALESLLEEFLRQYALGNETGPASDRFQSPSSDTGTSGMALAPNAVAAPSSDSAGLSGDG